MVQCIAEVAGDKPLIYLQSKNIINIGSENFPSDYFKKNGFAFREKSLKLNKDNCYYCFSLEEAFYLHWEDPVFGYNSKDVQHSKYSFNVSVNQTNEQLLNTQELWNLCIQTSDKFLCRYIVYRHYRKNDWIVRCSDVYGTDYALYRGSPDDFHSEYLILVKSNHTIFNWGDIQSFTRVSHDVKKRLLLCEVEFPVSHIEVNSDFMLILDSGSLFEIGIKSSDANVVPSFNVLDMETVSRPKAMK